MKVKTDNLISLLTFVKFDNTFYNFKNLKRSQNERENQPKHTKYPEQKQTGDPPKLQVQRHKSKSKHIPKG